MRKQGGDFYGFSLEKKVIKAIEQLFGDGLSELTVKDVITQLGYTGHDTSGKNYYKRVLNAVKNLAVEKSIVIEKRGGTRDIPTIIITQCLT